MQVNFQPVIKSTSFGISKEKFRSLFNTDAYTGLTLARKNKSVEHIRPVSKGGIDSFDNYLPVHKQVNADRGNMPLYKWFEIMKDAPKNIQKFLDRNRGLKIDGKDYVEAVKKTLNREARGFVSFRGRM